jgi:hypothetical protein
MLVEIIVELPDSEVNRLHAEIPRSNDTRAQTVLELVIRDPVRHQAPKGPS